MKAIPTNFNEVLYRSRLEARWAMFFEDIGVETFYEPWDIGGGYVPDFFLHNLFFNGMCIAEIKPMTPNDDYIKYLKSVRIPGKSDFLIFVGNPSFEQVNGVHIYGTHDNYVEKGFDLVPCERCGYYAIYDKDWGAAICNCCYIPPKPNWQQYAEKASQFRFDLC